MEPQTQKTQIAELLRGAENVIITVSQKPSVDQIASAIGLAEILHKLDKHAEVVISEAVPSKLSFLSTGLVKKTFSGIRDFVIDLDVSTVEADKLKYVPEGKKLKIYITPFNGNYSADDVNFSYGDFHCDAVIALGINRPEEMDKQIAKQKELLTKTKLVTINNAQGAGGQGLNWNLPTASALGEMIIGLAESLQPELLDSDIATSILTGIIAETEHFTNAKTSAKVMNLAAQLMAAGARQAEIIKHLNLSDDTPAQADKKVHPRPQKPATKKGVGELEPSEEQSLLPKKPEAAQPPTPPVPPLPPMPRQPISPPAVPVNPPPPVAPANLNPLPPTPPSRPAPPPLPPSPPRPSAVQNVRPDTPLGATPPPMPSTQPPVFTPRQTPSPLAPPVREPGDIAQPASTPTPPPAPAGSPFANNNSQQTPPAQSNQQSVDAARKAVEEATKTEAPDPTAIQDRFEPHNPQTGQSPPVTPPPATSQ